MDDQATESAERRAPKIFLFLTASLIPGIFALIAALAWNSLFVEIFNRLSRGREIVALVAYAVVVTLIALSIGFVFYEINQERRKSTLKMDLVEDFGLLDRQTPRG